MICSFGEVDLYFCSCSKLQITLSDSRSLYKSGPRDLDLY